MGLRTMLGLKRPKKKKAKSAETGKEVGKKEVGERVQNVVVKRPKRPRLAPLSELPDYAAWFEGKQFSTDWLSSKIVPWFTALEPWRGTPAEVLEVGSFEGRSAVVFLSYLPAAHLTCVDTFGLEDVTVATEDGLTVERRFDANMLPFGDRVTKHRCTAATSLDRMRAEGKSYDIVYLDADKRRDGVFGLSALAWPLLRVGGILIWDDLRWGASKPDAERPESAIRLFCSAFSSAMSVMHDDRQMIIRKTAAWPTASQTGTDACLVPEGP